MDKVSGFTTGNAACAPAVNPADPVSPINLGRAAGFGAFGGGAGVTNQGINTLVSGDLGTTAACTLITGLHDAANVHAKTPLNIGAVFGAPPAPGTYSAAGGTFAMTTGDLLLAERRSTVKPRDRPSRRSDTAAA